MAFTERLRILIEASSSDAIRGLQGTSGAAKEAQVAQGGLTKSSGLLGTALNKVGLEGKSTSSLIGTALAGGAIAGGAALAKFAFDGAQKFATLTGEVRKFQRVSLASAEDSSKLVFAVKRLGIEPDAAAASVGRLAQRIQDGKVKLDDFGISVKRNSDGTLNMAGTLLNVADRFSKVKDAGERASLGMAMFGKSWQTLLPLLGKGKGELQDIFNIAQKQGLVFNDAQLAQGKAYTLAIHDLKSAWEGLSVSVGQLAIPALTGAAGGLTAVVEGVNKLAQSGTVGKAVVDGLVNVATLGIPQIGQAAKAAFDGDWVGSMEHVVQAVPVVGTAIGSLLGWSDEATTASQRYKDAQNELDKALGKVADMEASGKTNTKDYAQAKRDAAAAAGTLAGEEGKQSKAMNDATTSAHMAAGALQQLTLATMGVHGAALNLEGAQLKAKQAHDQVAQAAMQVAAAEQQYGAGSLEAAAARDQLTQAQYGAKVADFQVSQSAIQLDGVMAKLKDTYGNNVAAIDRQIGALHRSAKAHPEAAAAIQVEIDQLKWYKASLDQIPAAKHTKHTADGSQAKSEAASTKAASDAIPKQTHHTHHGDGSHAKSEAHSTKAAVEDIPKHHDTNITGNASDVRSAAANAISAINSVPTSHTTTFRAVSEGDWSHRATGGPVSMGKAYVVGENGPEMFVAPKNGEILPNSAFQAAASGGDFSVRPGGGDMHFIIVRSVDEALDRIPASARPRARGFLYGRS